VDREKVQLPYQRDTLSNYPQGFLVFESCTWSQARDLFHILNSFAISQIRNHRLCHWSLSLKQFIMSFVRGSTKPELVQLSLGDLLEEQTTESIPTGSNHHILGGFAPDLSRTSRRSIVVANYHLTLYSQVIELATTMLRSWSSR